MIFLNANRLFFLRFRLPLKKKTHMTVILNIQTKVASKILQKQKQQMRKRQMAIVAVVHLHQHLL